jgi:outer membrane protein, multidrug efflux system
MKKSSLVMGVVALVSAMTGCTVGPDYHAPQVQVKGKWADAPATQPGGTSAGGVSDEWWKGFKDAEIDSLVERAMKSGWDLKIAAQRVLESRAQNEIAGSRELPTVNAGATYDYYRKAGPLGAVKPGDYEWYLYGFDASWEIDLFGGIRRGAESAKASYEASIEAQHGVRLALAAEVVRDYIELRTSQRRLAIAEENLKYQERTLAITRERLRAGVVSDLDESRAEALVEATRATIPPLKSDAVRAIRSIGVLLGEDPDALTAELEKPAPIPVAPAELRVGLPADLLRRRPDLRQAERQLAAATARIGVARADLLPHLNLIGSLGAHDISASDLVDWSRRYGGIGPSVSWNIFDAGRTMARIESEKAATAEALANYQKKVLDAIAETENEMTTLRDEREREKSLEASVEANKRSVKTGSELYVEGVTDFITVLDAERSLAASEDALAVSEQAIGVHAVSLCKALGGGWAEADKTAAKQ